MRIVKVSRQFFLDCQKHNTASELLVSDSGRPCVLLVKIEYKGKTHKFVIPFRSNISSTTPDEQFFHLPPNKNTKPGHSHGIHYIKLFPVTDRYIQRYRISDNDNYHKLIQDIIDDKERDIIDACKDYLQQCECGNKHSMTPDIDGIISWIYESE